MGAPKPSGTPADRARTSAMREQYRGWLEHNRHRTPATIASYDYILGDWFDHIAHRPEHATPDTLTTFMNRQGRYNARAGEGGPLSATTRRNNAVVVLGWYRWAHGRGLIASNPLWDTEPPTVDLGPPRAVTDQQFDQLAGHVAADPREAAMVALAHWSMLRAGEIAGAKIEEIHLDGPEPSIRVFGKRSKFRVVPIPSPAVTVLRRYLATIPRRSGPLFSSEMRAGAPVGASWVTRLMSRRMTEAGLPDGVTLHWLRHAGAQRARRLGVPIDVLSRWLGHASIRTTERYLRGWDPDLHEAARLLSGDAPAPAPSPVPVPVAAIEPEPVDQPGRPRLRLIQGGAADERTDDTTGGAA